MSAGPRRSSRPGAGTRTASPILTLDHVASRNALSDAMLAALQAHLEAIAADRNVAVVVLSAEGKAFCAGHHLKEMTAHRQDADRGRGYFEDLFARCAKLMLTIVNLPQPVIAAVDGRRDRGRLPARRELRPRGRRPSCGLRDARRRYRPVLLDADGRAHAQCPAQGGDGDASHRREGRRRRGAEARPRQPRRARGRDARSMPRSRSPGSSLRSRRSPSRPARPPSIGSSRCRSTRLTPMRRAS